jgi:hypothetical protein
MPISPTGPPKDLTGDHRAGIVACGGGRPGRAVLRLVLGGAVGMAVTYGIGALVGTAVG